MKVELSEDKSKLTLIADEDERAEWREMEFPDSDSTLYFAFDRFIANSEFQWIRPEETGDMTDAPMIGWQRETPDGTDVETYARWTFMNYQIESLLGCLIEKGRAVLIGGEIR